MIELSLKEDVYELAMLREPGNEIGTPMLTELERCLEEIDPAKGRALIIYSRVKSGFCAGADLRELYQGIVREPKDTHEAKLRAFLDRVHRVMDGFDMLPLTTIGLIHGVCFGGGFELALTCDILIAEQTARFCFPELRLGIIPAFGGIPRLKRELGNGVIRDLLFTGRSINAKKAQDLGLVSQVLAVNEGLHAARAMAAQTAKFDPEAQMAAKQFIKSIPREELAQEKEIMLKLFQNPVVTQALHKFVESKEIFPYLP